VVLLELLRRGYKVYYYKTKGDLECDFVVKKDREIVELIQVTVSLNDDKTRKRELAPFKKVVDELNLKEVKMTVLCEDSSKILSDGVEVVNVLEWLQLCYHSNRFLTHSLLFRGIFWH